MKNLILCLAVSCLFFEGCKKEKATIPEIPTEIIRTKADTTLYPSIIQAFPDGSNNMVKQPVLFSDTVTKEIILTQESEVYVTFISEGAVYKNTLGWYSYTLGNVPSSTKDFTWEILFPNISGKNEGGQLTQGDMLQLGTKKFPAGTVIGFFLIVQGWQDGTINYNNPVYFTNANFNQSKEQHSILFKNKGNIILGFEDLSYSSADKDFNDVLVSISDNKNNYESVAFDLTKVPNL